MSTGRSKFKTVLKVKSYLEKKAQGELHTIQEQHHQETEELNQLTEENESALGETIAVLKARATELQTSRAFLQNLSRQIERQKEKLEDIKLQEHSKREELTEKTQAKRMIEKLEEKREGEEAKENERKEQRLIDVLAHRIRFGF
ncbi:MAG: flagellar FliJ family protein [Ignavibacteriales bacterium]|nr:flagellar FliJ family protein [Ignavibacteriales bacterium]MBI3786879.1 flagellar FliJ family protein [Ignavibacteriales bacterium]